ncbi:MAG: hypothetical protein ACRC0R_05100 [Cetobacterium sp.]
MDIKEIDSIIGNSSHKYLGEYTVMGIKCIKLSCTSCNSIFINTLNDIVTLGIIECCNCEKEYPNVYGRMDNWNDNMRVTWVYNKVYQSHGDKYKQISEYEGRLEKVEFQCFECGNVWKVLPGNIFKGRGCPKCSGKHRHTSEEFEAEIKTLHKNSIILLSKYVNANTKIKCQCNTCGHVWESSSNSLRVRGCPECSLLERGLNSRIDEEDFLLELKNKHEDRISIVDGYSGKSKSCTFRCNICGREWKSLPKSVLRIDDCLDCSNKSRSSPRISAEQFSDRVESLHGKKYNLLEDFTGTKNKVLTECVNCGHIWNARSTGLMYGSGCPRCNRSIKEKQVLEFIREEYPKADNKFFYIDSKKYELDIYIKELNIGIEFDGLYWHSESKKGKSYHIEKQKAFNSIGIRTIHIREDEWAYKQEIVKSRLIYLIGKTKKRLFARRCDIRIVSNNIKSLFLDKYHIQGRDRSSLAFGLYYNGKILSIMTFGKVRDSMRGKNDMSENTYELIRFCSRTDLSIVGGFSKLLKHSINYLKDIGVTKIKTFADKRWSDGNVYSKNGFLLSHSSNPGYVYFCRLDVYSRQQFQKHKLEEKLDIFDPNLSEYANMLNNGYNRYWDCGQFVYYMEIN